MSYEPTNWKSGDTVTSAKLNKMEQGIANAGGGGGGALVVNCDAESGALDHTWQEIWDAVSETIVAIVKSAGDAEKYILYVCDVYADSGDYGLEAIGLPDNANYLASSADGYPVLQD